MAFSKHSEYHDRPLKGGRTEVLQIERPSTAFQKFLVVHSADETKPTTKQSVFLIAKCIENIARRDYNAMKLSSCGLLVEGMRKNQSENILKQEKIADLTLTVTPHRTLNTIAGVISKKGLLNETEADLFEGIQDPGVVSVRRITRRRDGNEIPTKHIILTFASTNRPETVKAVFISCRWSTYIPNPRRCFKFQKFGHVTQACCDKLTCAKCGDNDHPSGTVRPQ